MIYVWCIRHRVYQYWWLFIRGYKQNLCYRIPQQGYDYSPVQRLMSRRLRDIISTAPRQLVPQTVSPSVVQENIAERRRRSKAQYDRRVSAPLTEFSKGEKVYVKPRPTNKHQPWIYGELIGRPAPRSCLVSTAMGPAQRYHAQIREAKAEPVDNYDGRLNQTVSLPSESGPIEETDQPRWNKNLHLHFAVQQENGKRR